MSQSCIALAIRLALASLSSLATTAVHATEIEATTRQSYSIAAGSLGEVLSQFAALSGVKLSFDPAMVAELKSGGLQGTYSVREGFATILAGSGYELTDVGDGAYTLRDQPTPPGRETTLRKVKVTADEERDTTTEGTNSYTSNSTTIGKGALTLREIPQSVSVITRQRIEDQNMLSLEDALAQSTGFTVPPFTPGTGDIYARGFQVDALQFDGVAQTASLTSFSKPDLAAYDRVEVLRGSSGLLQGAGNPSAAINLVRKRPTDRFAASAALSGGSWNSYRAEIDLGGPLNSSGSLRGRAVAAYEDREYYIDFTESQKSVFYGIAELDLTSSTLLSAGVQNQRYDAVPLTLGMPRYNDGRALPVSRSTFLGADWNDWFVELTQAFATLEHRWSNDWQAKLSFEREWEQLDAMRTMAAGSSGFTPVDPATNAGFLSGSLFDYEYQRTGVDANISGPLTFAGRTHFLMAGINVRDNYADTSSAPLPGIVIPNVLEFDPRSAADPGNPAITSRPISDVTQYGLYGSARFSLADAVTLVIGGRVDRYDILSTNENPVTGVKTTSADYRIDDQFTPYGGVIWDVSERWSLYTSYADVFQPQTYQFKSDGGALDPLLGASYEAGIKGELQDDGALNFSAAVFHIEQTNRAVEDPSTPCATAAVSGWCHVADGEVRSQGLEAEISGRVTSRWQIFAGYTYNTTEYVEDAANRGKDFHRRTPKHLLRLWTDHQLGGALSRLRIGAGLDAQGDYYTEQGTARAEQDAYVLFNTRLAYRIDRRVTAALNVNNVFDRKYFATMNGLGWGNVYGEPRSFLLTLRSKW